MITPPSARCKVVTLLVAVIGVALSCFVLFAVPSPTEAVKVSPVAVARDEGQAVATTNSTQPTASSASAIPNSDAPRSTVQQSSGASPPLCALPLVFPQADPALLSDDEWTSSHATWGERLGKARHGDIVSVNGAVMGYVDKQSLCNTTTEAAVPALSSDKVVDKWIRDFAGQAAFAVSVVGKTFIARGATVLVRNVRTKQCHYLHLFRGPSGATLTVTRVLSAYRSLDEMADTVRIFDKTKVAQVVLLRDGAADVDATTTSLARSCLHFGFSLFNDWSARDIQRWEYVPLGPFLGKNFGSTISPWIVTTFALEPFRVPVHRQPEDPQPLPYLQESIPSNYDVKLTVTITTADAESKVVSASNMKYMHWSMYQQLTHHTCNGCNMRPGDLIGSGTLSGSEEGTLGSMLELAWNGTRPITFPSGAQRKMIQDGDVVAFNGECVGDGYRIGFGECNARLLPAKPY